MGKKSKPTNEDSLLFKEAVSGITPLKQDKIPPEPASIKKKAIHVKNNSHENRLRKQAAATFQFSDGFEAHFPGEGPLKWTKPGEDSGEVKRLRRGEYPPDLILDLHGYHREEAKLEIAALLHEANKRHLHCVCIVHGIGNRILKKWVPNWLVQHPDVLGFHNAPLEWGGNGALLVLLKND